MDYLAIIYRYYPEDNALRQLLLHHSRQVCRRALQIVDRHPELHANRKLVEAGAMLHDIGIFRTDAPGIHCHGTAHYLLHGIIGAEIFQKEAADLRQQAASETAQAADLEQQAQTYDALARICERHTGTGLTREVMAKRGLPTPEHDLLPETIEEQIICYADKFYSKSHLERERTIEQTIASLEKFGDAGVEKFRRWVELFE